MAHTCHAIDCKVHVEPEMLMCRSHWFMVPYKLRAKIWETYRPGQCNDWKPSEEYCKAAKAAVIAVAQKENRVFDNLHPAIALYDMFMERT